MELEVIYVTMCFDVFLFQSTFPNFLEPGLCVMDRYEWVTPQCATSISTPSTSLTITYCFTSVCGIPQPTSAPRMCAAHICEKPFGHKGIIIMNDFSVCVSAPSHGGVNVSLFFDSKHFYKIAPTLYALYLDCYLLRQF